MVDLHAQYLGLRLRSPIVASAGPLTSDVDRIVDFFAEDGVYHNVPMERVQGREAIRDLVASWLAQMGEIVHSARHEFPQDWEPGLETRASYDPPGVPVACATHVAVVKVDTCTGAVRFGRAYPSPGECPVAHLAAAAVGAVGRSGQWSG